MKGPRKARQLAQEAQAQKPLTQSKGRIRASTGEAPKRRERKRVQKRGVAVPATDTLLQSSEQKPAAPSSVTAWLGQVGKRSPPQAPPYYSESDTMARSGTMKSSTVGGMELLNKLERRGVSGDSYQDPKIQEYKKLVESLPVLKPTDLTRLKALLDRLASRSKNIKMPNEMTTRFFDEMLNDLSDWCMSARLPSISRRNFMSDVELCSRGNEHILHRTLMMTILDRYHLNKWLEIACEAVWSSEPLPLMKPAEPDEQLDSLRLTNPKPDLAVFFTRKAFHDPRKRVQFKVPASLDKHIHPDRKIFRCFPFFFLEAKAKEISLQEAEHKNLYTTSQALFNIYQWMKEANMKNEFFRNVRVFSLVMNSMCVRIRVHHAYSAEKEKGIELEYSFDEVCDERIDDRKDYFCAIVRNILHEYGIKILYPILKKTYNTIVVPPRVSSGLAPNEAAEAGPSQPPDMELNVQEQTTQMIEDTETEALDSQNDETGTEITAVEPPEPKRKSGRGRPKGPTKKQRTARTSGQHTPVVTESFIEEVGDM